MVWQLEKPSKSRAHSLTIGATTTKTTTAASTIKGAEEEEEEEQMFDEGRTLSELSGEVDIRYYCLKQTRFYSNFPLHCVVEDGCRSFLCEYDRCDSSDDSDQEGDTGGDTLQRESNDNDISNFKSAIP